MARGSVLRHTLTVGAFTMLSRVLGLVREMLQSRVLGAGVEQSAFTLAFAIPNMARKLFGEGALTAAFVPVFKSEVASESLEKAARLARAVMTMTLLMLGAIVLLAMGSLEIVIKFRAELGLNDLARLKLTIRLVKMLLPYMVFICGAAFGMGVLNALGRFKASSFMPCLLNVCWIGMLGWILLNPELRLDQRVHRIALAILIAGAVQMAFMLVMMARAGVVPRLTRIGWNDPKTRLVWHNVGLAALGAGAVQINYMLDQALAQFAAPWAAGVIGYAERLMDLPLGVIGVAFGTVLLPTFAGFFAKGDLAAAREALATSVRHMMFVMLPAAAGLLVLAPEVTRVIYEGGNFDALATVRVSRALAVYALGLGFFGLQKSLIPWFQAQNDMRTPLRVSVATVVCNAVLNVLAVLLLPQEWRHVGLAGSTGICALLGCVLLLVLARRRNGATGLAATVPYVLKVAIAAGLMGLALVAVRPHLTAFGSVVSLGVLVVGGMAVYGLASLALGTLRKPRRML